VKLGTFQSTGKRRWKHYCATGSFQNEKTLTAKKSHKKVWINLENNNKKRERVKEWFVGKTVEGPLGKGKPGS